MRTWQPLPESNQSSPTSKVGALPLGEAAADHRIVSCPLCGGEMLASINRPWAGWSVDDRAFEVHFGDRCVRLPVREYELFTALLRARGRPVTKQYLIDCVFGENPEADRLSAQESAIDVWVYRIRKRLPAGAIPLANLQANHLYRLIPAVDLIRD